MTMPTLSLGLGIAEPTLHDQSMILDDEEVGLLDENILTTTDVGFVTVNELMRGATIRRGASRAQGPLLRYEAGTATVVLRNEDRQFDPTNEGGPYFSNGEPNVVPMRPMRLRATWNAQEYDLWRGFIDGLDISFRKRGNYSDVVLTATDGFKVLGGKFRTALGSPVGAGETTGARIGRILDSASWTDRVVNTTQGVAVQGTTLEGDPLAELQLVVDTEGGEGFIDGAGRFVFRDRGAVRRDERSLLPQATFGDTASVLIALALDGTSGAYASTPDTAALDITGDIDIRVACAADDWTPAAAQTFLAKDDAATNTSYRLELSTSREPVLVVSANGTTLLSHTATAPLSGVADKKPIHVRATLDVDDGSGNRIARFYTKPFDRATVAADLASDIGWNQLGDAVVVAATTTIFSGTAPLEIGSHGVGTAQRFTGDFYGAVVKSGIAGTAVANPDFTAQEEADASFADTAGRTWTVNGDASLVIIDQELPYEDVRVQYDDTQIANEIKITRVGGNVQTSSDPASQSKYLVRTYERSGLLFETDPQALEFAAWLRDHNSLPELRFNELKIRPQRDPDRLFPQVLGREIGDRITIVLHPSGGGVIRRDVFIRGISHEVTQATWETTWALQDVNAYDRDGVIRLDESPIGEDDGEVIGPGT